MGKLSGIKIYVPASIANFGAGLNIISAAVEAPGDEIIATIDHDLTGIKIDQLSGYKDGLSKESEYNSAAIAGQLLLDHLGEKKLGIRFKIHKNIPVGSGLSSNAADSVAGVFAVNELLGRPLERYDLISFAEKAARKFNIRSFPAQVASILFGGIILYRGTKSGSFQKIYCPEGIQITLIIPGILYNEAEKLQFLDSKRDLDQRVREIGNTAAFISSLYTSDFTLLSEVIQEKEMDQGLKNIYPYVDTIAEITKEEGGYGCGLAGLGPVAYVVSPNTLIATEISNKIAPIFKSLQMEYKVIHTKIDLNGVYKF